MRSNRCEPSGAAAPARRAHCTYGKCTWSWESRHRGKCFIRDRWSKIGKYYQGDCAAKKAPPLDPRMFPWSKVKEHRGGGFCRDGFPAILDLSDGFMSRTLLHQIVWLGFNATYRVCILRDARSDSSKISPRPSVTGKQGPSLKKNNKKILKRESEAADGTKTDRSQADRKQN